MVEGLAVGLRHVVGDLDEGHDADRGDEQGRQSGDLCSRNRQGAYQKGTEI